MTEKKEDEGGKIKKLHPWKWVLLSSILIVAITLGLRYWEKVSQKPRLIKAIQNMTKDYLAEEYAMDGLWDLLKEGKTSLKGYLNLSHLNVDLLSDKVSVPEDFSIAYQINRDITKEEMDFMASFNFTGTKEVHINGYIDAENTITQIPQLHDNYLRIQNKNIRNQYEKSLFYAAMKEEIPFPEKEFSIEPFKQKFIPEQSFRMKVQSYAKEQTEAIAHWKEKLTIKKRDIGDQIFLNGEYVGVSIYDVSFPVEIIRDFFVENTPEIALDWIKEHIVWEEDAILIAISLDDKGRILRIKGSLTGQVDKKPMTVNFTLDRKGNERLSDINQLEFEMIYEEKTYGFALVTANEWDGEKNRVLHMTFQMEIPVKMKIFDADILYQMDGTTKIEYAVDTPELSFDGEHEIRALSQEIEKPTGEVTDIFQMNLMEFLQFTSMLDYSFFDD